MSHTQITEIRKQKDILKTKQNILTTRNRMLQLSQDINLYKQKVIYTLLSIIILCFIVILLGYSKYRG